MEALKRALQGFKEGTTVKTVVKDKKWLIAYKGLAIMVAVDNRISTARVQDTTVKTPKEALSNTTMLKELITKAFKSQVSQNTKDKEVTKVAKTKEVTVQKPVLLINTDSKKQDIIKSLLNILGDKASEDTLDKVIETLLNDPRQKHIETRRGSFKLKKNKLPKGCSHKYHTFITRVNSTIKVKVKQ